MKRQPNEAPLGATLPRVNEDGCYEIRLESIGGLGANLCGKLLGELGALYLGLNAAAFSSYGSEKRGSPVRSYVRYSAPEREILQNCPVEHPHLLVLFHHALAGSLPVTAGFGEDSLLVVNTDKSPDEIGEELGLWDRTIFCINAGEVAIRTKSRINMVMLGAISRASGFIPLEAASALVKDTLGKKYPDMLEKNLEGLYEGYHGVRTATATGKKPFVPIPYHAPQSKWGYQNAPLGGVNPHFGSTVSNDLCASREGYIPLFLPEKCIHCGLCDSTCPDMVFQFTKGEYRGKEAMLNRGLDYHHCKGCLRCVDVCPTGALVTGKEQEHPQKKHFVRNKDLIAKHIDFDVAGADASVTGEAYLDEKRVDGGLL